MQKKNTGRGKLQWLYASRVLQTHPLTDHGLYAVAHEHWQKAMVGGCAGAVDDIRKLWRPLQVNYRRQSAQRGSLDVLT